MPKRRFLLLFFIATLGACLLAPPSICSAQASNERRLPKQYQRSPFSLMSLSVGHPNRGWQVRAKKLRPSNALRIKKPNHTNAYGHPALVLMLQRSAGEVAKASPGSVLLVGDLSREQGGPLAGHRSHQSGRDADTAFYMRDSKGRNHVPEYFIAFDAQGKAKDGSGLVFDDQRNWLLVLSWIRDERAGLSHIFVSQPLRSRILAYGKTTKDWEKHGKRASMLLKQPANSSSHDDHFHVRISCPRGQQGLCHEEGVL